MARDKGIFGLSGNALKIIGAITMLIDHMGVVLFPGIAILRIIGRISFPIFAFMIAEGCHYTKNKLRYFLSIFILGAGCQVVYSIYGGGRLLGVLIVFSISIPVIYAMQYMKRTITNREKPIKQGLSVLIFALSVFVVYVLNELLLIDYGFFGCMAPVFASSFKIPREINRDKGANSAYTSFLIKNEHLLNVSALGICLIFLAFAMTNIQFYALLSLPPILLYSGKRGKYRMKYFFYIFYPLHLAALEGISYLLKVLAKA